MRDKLIKARGDRTQGEIATICRVSQQTVSHWETGRATPPIKTMLLLEKHLGVPKEELFSDIFYSENELQRSNATKAPSATST